jgi:hypothetical protein
MASGWIGSTITFGDVVRIPLRAGRRFGSDLVQAGAALS